MISLSHKAPSPSLGPLDPTIAVSVIIVNRNTCDLLRNALRSLREAADRSYEVIVVDNASTDASVVMVRSEYPEAVIIQNVSNCGFAQANNQGLARARGRFFLLLNSDTVVHRGAIDRLVAYLEQHAEVGIVGPRLLNFDGTIQTSIIPFRTLYHDMILLLQVPDWPLAGSFLQYLVQRRNTRAAAQTGAVDSLLGACLLIRRELLMQIGGLDSGYFFTWEETDLCRRSMLQGWLRSYVVEAEVTHLGGQSWKRLPAGQTVWMCEGRLRYYYKHHKRWEFVALRLFTLLAAIGHEIFYFVQGETYDDQMRAWGLIFKRAWNVRAWLS